MIIMLSLARGIQRYTLTAVLNPLLFLGILLAAPGLSYAMTQVGIYKTHELVFTADSTPANPFDTYLRRLEITDPGGKAFTIEGFYDGDGKGGQRGKTWKARIAPYQTGIWKWRTVRGDAPDPGLSGLSGQFEVVAGSDKGGIIADGQYFRFQNGDFVYLQGHFLDNRKTVGPPLKTMITTHVYMAENDVNDAERAQILATQLNDHAINKINLYYSNQCDYQGQRVTPWLNNNRRIMDLSHWRLYDGYLEQMKDSGLHASMWGFSDCYKRPPSIPELKRLFRYAMARHSAYNNTSFTLGLEYIETYSSSQMNILGNYVSAKNPWKRMLTVHHVPRCRWDFANQSWPDYASVQEESSGNPGHINSCAIKLHDTIEPEKPGLDEEFFHDQMPGGEKIGRNLVWANFAGGAAGGGTGAGLRAFMHFLEISHIPHQRMKHNNNAVQGGGTTRFALSEADHHHLVYTLNGLPFSFSVSGDGLTGYWYNPRQSNAKLHVIGTINSGNQRFSPPTSGSSDDWVLWITDGTRLNSGKLYTSPGARPTQEIITPASGVTRPAPPGNLKIRAFSS